MGHEPHHHRWLKHPSREETSTCKQALTMEKTNSRRSSSSSGKLKHRFAQLLLGSSCSTTIAAAVVGQTSAGPQHPEAQEPGPGRRKHDVGVVHVPVHCSARQVSEQFLPLMTKEEEEEEVEEEGNEKKERRRVVIGSVNYYDAKQRSKKACGRRTKGGRAEAKKLLSNAYGFTSSSSMDAENELRLFSSDEAPDEESGTLFSSKSFSSDSPEFYHHSRKTNKRRNKSMKSTRRPPRRHAKHVRGRSCGGIDQLRPLVSISSKEKKGTPSAGFAVVTRSCDPYNDFRSSMVEMIVERGMSRARDLERLLNSYLSLNSPRHHQVILEAFADIREAIFGK